MDNRALRVAVAGCGPRSTATIWPCLRLGEFDVAYAHDTDRERAETTRRRFGAARATTSWGDVLDDESVEAVLVVGTGTMNYGLALDSLTRGKHVFLGSAPAETLDQILHLADVADRTGVRCQVGFQKRFALNYRRAHDAVARAESGVPTLCKVNYSHFPVAGWRAHLCDMSLHAIDLTRYFMGDPSEAYVVKRSADDTRRTCVVTLLYESGGVAVVNLSSNDPGVQEWVELSGGGRLVSVDNLVECRITADGRGSNESEEVSPIVTAERWTPPFAVPFPYADSAWLQGYAGAVVEFAASILSGRDVSPSLADATAAMRIVEAILRAPEGMSELDLRAAL